MLITINDNLIINTNSVSKITLNRDGSSAWLLMIGENKAIHIEPSMFKSIHRFVSARTNFISNDLNKEIKIDYTKPHKFEAIMDDPNTCTCGLQMNNEVHK